MSGLTLPNIAKKIVLQKKEETERKSNTFDIIITGRTPIGTIVKVPTSKVKTKHLTKFEQLPDVKGVVSREIFEKMLEIYENNQVFYQDKLEEGILHISIVKQGLTKLEHWFAMILEPVDSEDVDDWLARESYKIEKRVTIFCDEHLAKYCDPIPDKIIRFIKESHSEKKE